MTKNIRGRISCNNDITPLAAYSSFLFKYQRRSDHFKVNESLEFYNKEYLGMKTLSCKQFDKHLEVGGLHWLSIYFIKQREQWLYSFTWLVEMRSSECAWSRDAETWLFGSDWSDPHRSFTAIYNCPLYVKNVETWKMDSHIYLLIFTSQDCTISSTCTPERDNGSQLGNLKLQITKKTIPENDPSIMDLRCSVSNLEQSNCRCFVILDTSRNCLDIKKHPFVKRCWNQAFSRLWLSRLVRVTQRPE